MREDRRKRYDDGFRHEALGLIKAGAGKHFLARRLAMPVQTAEKWIMKYRSNGEDAVMGAKGKRSYDWGTKVAAARDHVDNDMTKTEVMAKYAIAVFCQIFVGRFGVSFSPFERLFLGRFGFGQSCGLSVIA